MMSDLTNNKHDRVNEIGALLCQLEGARPGTVRLKANPLMTREVMGLLETFGLKKRFLSSGEQFIYDSILSHPQVMQRILPSCILAGPSDGAGLALCWGGRGAFAGSQGLFQLTDFTKSGKQRVTLIINIEPFFDTIASLLEAPR